MPKEEIQLDPFFFFELIFKFSTSCSPECSRKLLPQKRRMFHYWLDIVAWKSYSSFLDVAFKEHFGVAAVNLALLEPLQIFGQLQIDGKFCFLGLT